MLKRFYNNLNILFSKKKVLIIYGARQVGKTTLLESFLTKMIVGAQYFVPITNKEIPQKIFRGNI